MWKLALAVALAGCATLKNPDHWDTGNEVGAFVAPTRARFTAQPQAVDHDVIAVERTAPTTAAVSEVSAAASASIVGGVGRVGVVFAKHVVAGLEFEGGAASSTARDAATTDSSVLLGGAAVLGLTARRDRISIGAELVAGMRKLERHSEDGNLFFVQGDGFVEPRLRAHAWLWSWLALGVYVALDDQGVSGTGIRVVGSFPTASGGARTPSDNA